MKNIKIADTTLIKESNAFSFKEKLELARKLDMLNIDIIEIPEIENNRADTLFIKTISSFIKKSIISVTASKDEESVNNAALALKDIKNSRIKIELPVSPVGMEYTCHKKPDKMLVFIENMIKKAKALVSEVEFAAKDATRAEPDFFKSVIKTAKAAGADIISVYDNAAEMMPDEFADFIKELSISNKQIGILCEDKNGLAIAKSIMAVKNGAKLVKTSCGGNVTSLETFAEMIKNSGERNGFSTNIKYTQLNRIINQINWIIDNKSAPLLQEDAKLTEQSIILLDSKDTIEAVSKAVMLLGYDLSEEDLSKVYEEFIKTAEKKTVAAKELDAIIASVALQVPSTYKLANYVINSGNILTSSAQITLEKDNKEYKAVQIGDGPIDAAFRAIDTIVGHHYELDDFQIQAVTEGKGAMGSAVVKLRQNGKLYSGNGISTDIIGASIKAYINAVNKIVYEEA